ncbi:cell wall glycosyl hydrolase YteR [Drepanopeziza brunnea f. sp. 'multigermtubi' MB_m1]|uniref:Cell wall glycosyl hydrolase YteR n=1 Tax=Marssonina brunnea f. sp. multigermtubi (strain MB_m1) TaxID=1072389 RepID=K1X3L4_MARBU|nr:cell wall glycosyl hydrolase YteR [Drepanopeziza brunnea f. sp. 'multigermtubi' MB_m1]EKD19826.1 cell wall glycosyl hydrolase YteR [Drepanopeziza brunnea f. sp. 'multigermtubi' MB_m1]
MRTSSTHGLAVFGLATLAAAMPEGAATAGNCPTPRMSVQGADTILLREYALGLANGEPKITYEHGVAWMALEMVHNATSEAKYLDHIKKALDNLVTTSGELNDYNLTAYTLDDIRIGETLIYLNKETGEDKYKAAADLLFSQLETNPRNSEGGFWHRLIYPNQMWLDGLYMVSPFYAHHTAYYTPTNTAAFDDIVNQFVLTNTNCVNSNSGQSGLLKHGYDESREAVWADKATGASPETWSRALGWYVMALVDVLDYLPASHPGAATLKEILETSAAAIKKAVDTDSKMWWLVMSQPGKEGNYIESSGSAMFVYAMLKGIRMGYLDESEYKETATVAYEAMVEKFVSKNADGGLDWEGTVSVGSLKGNGDYAYYVSVELATNDLKGFGPFIMASMEYEKAMCA